jgi:hypothetical protein
LVEKAGRALAVRTIIGAGADTEAVVSSLRRGRPVIVSFLCENKCRPGTSIGHYSAIYGADLERGTFLLANPFWGSQEIGIDEFWGMSELRGSAGAVPLSIKLGRLTGALKPRTIFQLVDPSPAPGRRAKR